MANGMLPAMMVLALDPNRRRRSRRARQRRLNVDAILPAMIPGPAAGRVALAVVTSDQANRRVERREEQLTREAVTGIEKALSVQGQGKLTPADLQQLPLLSASIGGRPELLDRIITPSTGGQTALTVAVKETTNAILRAAAVEALAVARDAANRPGGSRLNGVRDAIRQAGIVAFGSAVWDGVKQAVDTALDARQRGPGAPDDPKK